MLEVKYRGKDCVPRHLLCCCSRVIRYSGSQLYILRILLTQRQHGDDTVSGQLPLVTEGVA
jgi:hypothetical protein